MKIFIAPVPDRSGYSITTELDDGTMNIYPNTVSSLSEALAYVQFLANEVEKATGVLPESFVSAAAIRENRNRDIDARRLWNNPDFRVVR